MKTLYEHLLALAVWFDRKIGRYKEYSYETAPYCGHYYNGHEGWLTGSHYHEGDGYCRLKIGWLEIGYYTEEGHYCRFFSSKGIRLWEYQRHVVSRMYVWNTWSLHGLTFRMWSSRDRRTGKRPTAAQKMTYNYPSPWFGLLLKHSSKLNLI